MINPNIPTKLPEKIKPYWLTKIILLLLPFLFFPPAFLILIIFLGLPLFLYLLLWYECFNFIIEENKITINSGIIIKRSKSIPFGTIQKVENIQGIMHRLFGLSRINIWTSSPEQIRTHKGTSIHRPDGRLDLLLEDGEWLNNFILDKQSK
jgi:uncharacterized membrane protein YdbT with pleckstrin-like domain